MFHRRAKNLLKGCKAHVCHLLSKNLLRGYTSFNFKFWNDLMLQIVSPRKFRLQIFRQNFYFFSILKLFSQIFIHRILSLIFFFVFSKNFCLDFNTIFVLTSNGRVFGRTFFYGQIGSDASSKIFEIKHSQGCFQAPRNSAYEFFFFYIKKSILPNFLVWEENNNLKSLLTCRDFHRNLKPTLGIFFFFSKPEPQKRVIGLRT